jgi:hypothetical protein
VGERDGGDGGFGAPGGFGGGEAVEQQAGADEVEAGEAAWGGVVLRGVAEDAHQFFGRKRRDAAHEDRPAAGMDEAGHQVHQCGLARAVGADQARDAGRNLEIDFVDPKHLAVELRDAVK